MTLYFQDRKQFEFLFKEYFTPLVNFIFKYINDWEEAREIVQDTFLKAWDNKDKLDIQTSVKNYLHQASRNTMIDHIRKKKRYQEKLSSVNEAILAESMEEAFNPMIIRQAVFKSLNQLKPKTKKIFILSKFEGLTYQEIADHLEISKRTVEDNISRAQKFLKEELKKHPDIAY